MGVSRMRIAQFLVSSASKGSGNLIVGRNWGPHSHAELLAFSLSGVMGDRDEGIETARDKECRVLSCVYP